jgi:hypothetical protein
MYARWCLLILLGAAVAPAAHASMPSSGRILDGGYLSEETSHSDTFLADRLSFPIQQAAGIGTNGGGWHVEESTPVLFADRGHSEQVVAAAPLAAPVQGAARSTATTLIDTALMLLVGLGLLAYPLEHQQRVLRQSALSSSAG